MTLKDQWNLYKEYLWQIRWPFNAKTWVLISILVAVGFTALFGVAFFILELIPVHIIHGQIMTVIIFIVLIDVLIAAPYLKAVKRIEQIEISLPDALKQMSDTLKAGGTFEYALRGISSSEYGPLTEEMNLVLRRLEEGENLENSLRGFSRNVHSRMVDRAINIILDSISAGASLADILEEIADDIKANQRILHERRGSTLMQVLFMIAAGVFVSPFIFGLILSILSYMMIQSSVSMEGDVTCYDCYQNGTNCGPPTRQQPNLCAEEASIFCNPKDVAPEEFWSCSNDSIMLAIVLYVLIETIAIGLMIAMIRDGKITKSFIYIPVLLLVAYIVFFISSTFALTMLGGV